MEDIRKTKEINSTFNSKLLHQNIQEIVSVKQKLAQSRTELQQNCNEAKKLKDHIAQVIESDSQVKGFSLFYPGYIFLYFLTCSNTDMWIFASI